MTVVAPERRLHMVLTIEQVNSLAPTRRVPQPVESLPPKSTGKILAAPKLQPGASAREAPSIRSRSTSRTSAITVRVRVANFRASTCSECCCCSPIQQAASRAPTRPSGLPNGWPNARPVLPNRPRKPMSEPQDPSTNTCEKEANRKREGRVRDGSEPFVVGIGKDGEPIVQESKKASSRTSRSTSAATESSRSTWRWH